MLAVAQLKKYKKAVEEMEIKMESKNAQLEELQRSLRRDWTNVSHLSGVSIFFKVLHGFYQSN